MARVAIQLCELQGRTQCGQTQNSKGLLSGNKQLLEVSSVTGIPGKSSGYRDFGH